MVWTINAKPTRIAKNVSEITTVTTASEKTENKPENGPQKPEVWLPLMLLVVANEKFSNVTLN
jgi:hypothetical protein